MSFVTGSLDETADYAAVSSVWGKCKLTPPVSSGVSPMPVVP